MKQPETMSGILFSWWRVRHSRYVIMAAASLYFAYLIALHKRLPRGHNIPKKILLQNSRFRGNAGGLIQAAEFMSPNDRALHYLGLGGLDDAPVRDTHDGKSYGYVSLEELEDRKYRFPSWEDRVKVYMSNWYLPPCDENYNAQIQFKYRLDSNNNTELLVRELPGETDERRVFLLRDKTEMASLFYMQRLEIERCENDFCLDTMKYLFPSLDRAAADLEVADVPMLMQFGDAEAVRVYVPGTKTFGYYPNIPIIKKFRQSFTRESITAMGASKCVRRHREIHSHHVERLQPIIWKLTFKRHFGMLEEIPRADRPWSEKIPQAIWRGALTGIHKAGFTNIQLEQLTASEKCDLMHRCKLVVNTIRSPLVNASLVGPTKGLPPIIRGAEIFGEKLDYADMLKYKAIIMLEGNDISSGFKWALYSRSVVMTTPPTLTSWAMEEMLVPWIHYIPLNEDLTDVEEKMQWVIDNDEEARMIAHRGSLWIKDLILHPDVERDDQRVFDEIIRRYRAHFVKDPNLFFFG